MSFIFKKLRDRTNKFDFRQITFLVPENDIPVTDLVEQFEDFLRACGYGVESGALNIREEPSDDA